MIIEELYRTSVHEAGHAVMVHALGAGSITSVSVEADERHLGRIRWQPRPDPDRHHPIYERVAVMLGGPVAEAIACNEEVGRNTIEHADAMDLLRAILRPDRARDVCSILKKVEIAAANGLPWPLAGGWLHWRRRFTVVARCGSSSARAIPIREHVD